jgi:hypothetical protein
MLGVKLSVRNVSPTSALIIRFVDYYDTRGDLVRRYLDGARRLRPLESFDVLIHTWDDTGGSGANFLVGWLVRGAGLPPLTEAVMVGHAGSGYVSFTSRGVEVEKASTRAVQSAAKEAQMPAEAIDSR